MNTDSIFSELIKVQSWPTVGLVFGLVIVVGYCFRFWKFFPNEAIPTVVILTGAIAALLLAPEHPANISGRVWHTRNFIVGLIVGFAAWMGHSLLISRLEDWLSSKFDSVGKLFGKSTGVTAPPPQNVEPKP